MEGFGGRISRLPLGFSAQEAEGMDLLALNFFSLGPNAAYAHTFVWRGFFLTGMLSAALPLSYSQQFFHEPNAPREHVFGVGMQLFLRGFVGYDAGRWSVNANYVHNRVELLAGDLLPMTLMTGNYRINFIYRFGVSERVYPIAELFNLRRYL
ncbi:hypothetical protein A3SI_09428 [Nitritalea halalkaliphila LW7]|uniref:Uncharacterized protein n=1 Tax=Nitritalea halalkaliphila LW7 TaxID=1189621 RepID=I5C4B4_9BACT|nr:DUF4421 family protein [Nitritalea halalkaliphila]EIM76666.1 hypothetical protein A3SI_09428 [Nitritalea halalkaliphila LW7]